MNYDKLPDILNRAVDNKKVFGASFCVKLRDELWQGSSGNLSTGDSFFIASTTKLYVTAIILKLLSEDELRLEDRISDYLPDCIMHGLHIYKGKDYSRQICIRQLLAHTSGIPDYFQQKNSEGNSLELELIKGIDRSWTPEEAIELSKGLEPPFIPGTNGKAFYSDTNFQLLGRIIENITGKPFDQNLDEFILQPLGLKRTYMYRDANDEQPKKFYYKDKILNIPKAMTSFGTDGGIVSTADELLFFLEAFFSGKVFPAEFIGSLKSWNRIFYPMQSGVGIHLFRLPWLFNPFGQIPELIGHSGLSGALAYHSPDRNLYIAGTVNQVANPDSSFRLAIKLVMEALKK